MQETNLTSINTRAFTESSSTLKLLSLQNVTLNSITYNNNVFAAISSLLNVEYIIISFDPKSNITSIPENAFQQISGVQSNLRRIDVWGSFNTIGVNAFYDVPNLEIIRLSGNQINYIPSGAFDFRQSSNSRLNVDLSYNQLNQTSFQVGLFLNPKRPLYIDLSGNQLKHLDMNVFCPFFQSNGQNIINLQYNILDCDCLSYWIVRQNLTLNSRIFNARCRNNQPIWDYNWNCDDYDTNFCPINGSMNFKTFHLKLLFIMILLIIFS